MKKIFTLTLLVFSFVVSAQNYSMSNTVINTCSGTFFDSGGAGGSYSNNQNLTMTFCPSTPGSAISIDFTSFNTELNADLLYVYDGTSVGSPQIAVFSGTNIPGVVIASGDNPSGCITIRFVSDGGTVASGWSAAVSCVSPCQIINAQLLGASPAPNGSGLIRICQGDQVTFNGGATFSDSSDGAVYEWDFGNGLTSAGATGTTNYSSPGVYKANLKITDPNGCRNTNLLNVIVQVSTEPDFYFSTNTPQICVDKQGIITGFAEPVPFNYECTPPVSGTTFLPDVPNGTITSYSTCIAVDCFDSDQTITSANQILDIFVNIEHSFLGDLSISIVSPSGQTATLKAYPGGGGTFLGDPIDQDLNPDGTPNTNPGVGSSYSFSMSGTVLLVNGPTQQAPISGGNSVVPGTYLPVQSFANLIGSPLNGSWCISITDNLGSDNGFIFAWGINFDPDLVPGDLSFTPEIVSEGWILSSEIVSTSGNDAVVSPSEEGFRCFTYYAVDNFDCTYTDSFCIEGIEVPVTVDPSNIVQCETIYNLTQIQAEMADGQLGDFVFYETEEDANNEFPIIEDPTAYFYDGVDPKEIFVSFFISGENCPSTKSFLLVPLDLDDIDSLKACDDISNDGFEIFDLTSLNIFELFDLDPDDYTISYFNSLEDAENNENPIENPDAYNGTNEIIFIRIQNNNIPLSFCVSSFNLEVIELPVVPIFDDLEACDSYVLPALTVGSYYTEAAGTGTMLSAGDVITETQTLFIYAETSTTPNCFTESSFTITINETPEVDVLEDVSLCDAEDIEGYTLPVLTEGSYFTAPDGGGTELAAGDLITSSQVIYIYAETGTVPNCTDESSFEVTISSVPVLTEPSVFTVCDNNNDGFGVFDITSIYPSISSEPNLVFTVHETEDDAIANENAISNPGAYANININTQVVHIRVTEIGGNGCPAFTTLQLVVTPRPVLNLNITDFELCDVTNSGDETEPFILNNHINAITNGQIGLTVAFYESAADAANETNPIAGNVGYDNTSNPQEIWTRVTNTSGCFTIGSFELLVNPVPVILDPLPLEICSVNGNLTQGLFDLTVKNNEITQAVPSYIVSYYVTEAQAISANNPLPTNYTGNNGQTVFVRVEDGDTGCFSITSLLLQVVPSPTANTPAPYELCDDNNDGFQVFDLTSVVSQITNGQGSVVVNFYETQTDADFGVNAIPMPEIYTNIVQDTQTIYVGVTSLVNGCISSSTLQLVVNPRPEATIPEDFEVCDNNFDGIGTFDLSTMNSEVLGALNPTTHTVTYYTNQNNAIAGINPISNIFNFNNTIADNQQIWVRVTINATGCFEVVPLNLVVLPLPVVNLPDPISLCDENNPGDEVEVFDLTSRIEQMIGIQTGLAVTFHTTFNQAQNNTNAIADPTAYSNTVNAQTLHVRITNQDTGCFVTTLLDIRVEPLPILVLPTEVTAVCDPTQDGLETVDLSVLEIDLLNGADDIAITFYETEYDAANALNSLNNLPSYPLYEIPNPFIDFIYIRAEDVDTGCYNVYMLELNVYPSPLIPETLPDLTLCDEDNNPFNGLTAFDLTTQTPILLNAQAVGSYTVRYFVSEQNAQDNVSAIVNTSNFTNSVNPQTIWVRVENNATGCFTIGTFQLNVNTPIVPVVPTVFAQCNEDLPNEGTTSFDLTLKDNEILGGQAGSVVYYVTEADRDAQVNAIVDPTNYTNLSNAQTLFATLISPAGCKSETTLTILVLPLPTINQDPDGFEACDYDNPGNGTELFDLTERESYILNNQNINGALTIVYYPSEADALAMTNPILNPSAYEGSGTVYVAVSNFSTNYQTTCTVYAPITLTVYPLPELMPAIPNYAQCEGGSDGFMDFDLQSYNGVVLAAGLDPADFNFTYYGSLADANAQTNPLPDVYTNTTAFTETVYVYVTNATTNCGSAIGSFVLEVQEGGVLNPINSDTNDFTLTACDYDGDNNGITTFDLDSYVSNVLGAQDPTVFAITYYGNEADAIAQSNPLADTANYETANTSIWVVISNNVNSCYYYQEVVITVNEIPVPILTADNPVCIDLETGEVVREATLDSGLDASLYTFEWLDETMNVVGTASTYSASAAGDYSIIATEIATGCMSDIQTINVIESAQAIVTYVITNAFAETQTIEATANAFGASEYVYQLDDGPVQETGLFENIGPGDHTLYVY
uniref:PKD domain-containing protein n=1 Tax=Flavobacterium sp. TaxID=239 RepID=UPI00404A8612